jgi:hypothetical protein
MSESKAAVGLGDEPRLNTFFFRSPFRSWQFVLNTILLAVACIESAAVVWKHWVFSPVIATFVLLMVAAISPYQWALARHKKIMKLYRSGKIAPQTADSPLNDLLEVADNSMNEGLRNTSFTLIALLAVLLWRIYHP